MSNADPLQPRENAALLGQQEAESTLLRAWTSGRLAHAWLLTGPRGIGKATLAYRFARFLLAKPQRDGLFGPPTDLAMETDHPVFRRIAAGGHADLMSVERGWDDKRKRYRNEIVVSDVREVGGFLHLTAAEGGWRVVVVDAADEMNQSAANAILKVLEEPPLRAVLLMVSHAPGRLLPTIRSRCRQLRLLPLPSETVSELLRRRLPDRSNSDRRVLAGLGDGSIGRALALAEQGGLTLYKEILALLSDLPSLDGEKLHALGDRLAKRNSDPLWQAAREILTGSLGRLVKARATGRPPLASGLPDETDLLVRMAASTAGLDRWLEVWEKTNHLLGRADGANLDRKQVVLEVFFNLQAATRPIR